jgi:hypothetical protein
MVEIARADVEGRGHFGLRQASLAAKAAKAMSEEQLGRGHVCMPVNLVLSLQVKF